MQVRNLKSCIKAAIDFVSPESFEHVLELTQERRWLTLREAREKPEEAAAPPQQRRHGDKLQVGNPLHGPPLLPWPPCDTAGAGAVALLQASCADSCRACCCWRRGIAPGYLPEVLMGLTSAVSLE